MKTQLSLIALSLLVAAPAAATPAAPQAAPQATPQGSHDKRADVARGKDSPGDYSQPDAGKRAQSYYNFAMGRLYEELYEASSRGEYANQAIEFYKKAYELDPRAPVIGERLAEIYFKSQRIRDAVLEAQEILKRDPDNLPARRLLAHIYVRTLGDLSGAAGQRETVGRAIRSEERRVGKECRSRGRARRQEEDANSEKPVITDATLTRVDGGPHVDTHDE